MSKVIAYAIMTILLYASLSAGAQLVDELRAKYQASMAQLEQLAQ